MVNAPCQVRQVASGSSGPSAPGHPERVENHTSPMAPRSARVAWSTSGLTEVETTRAVPLQHRRDDHADGLVAAGRAVDQHRMAVLSGQQPPQAAGAAQDQPARLGGGTSSPRARCAWPR